MRRPSRIVIAGKTYRVKYLRRKFVADEAQGDADFNCCVIRVATGGHQPAVVLDTLVHEVLHAVFEENPALRTLLDRRVRKAEEKFVSSLAPMLADMVARNGWGGRA